MHHCCHCLQDEKTKEAKAVEGELATLRFKRTLRQLAIVQDFADAAIAVNDLRGGIFSVARISDGVASCSLDVMLCSLSAGAAHMEAHACPVLLVRGILQFNLTATRSPCCCEPTDGKGRLSSPVFLSLLGLMSAGISAHKNWPR